MAVHTLAGRALPMRPAPAVSQRGFTFIALLCALVLLSLATQGVVQVVSQQAQREREEALLRTGSAFVQAIGNYYEATPGVVKRWPVTLEELLEDKRLVQIKRHVREIYPDPITQRVDWDLVMAPDGGIQGIRSRSTKAPIRRGAVQTDHFVLPAAQRYSDWAFVYQPDVAGRSVNVQGGRQ